ncbi:MAG: hypothetical protein L6R19_20970 [Alphaproteobacteria bacterium]|nr:hypothetical protein [Alphaproteobacteria bacterium]
MRFRHVACFAAVTALALAAGTAWARVWKPSPLEQISDYLFIVDPKPDGSQVMVFWIDPRVGGEDEDQARLRGWLRDRVLIGVAEVDIRDGSSMMPRKVGNPQVLVGGRPRPSIAEDAFDAELKQASDFARELIGAAGHAFRFFAVADAKFGACQKGSMHVVYAGERYLYRLPAPGCAAKAR